MTVEIINADCISTLKSLPRKADFLFADPPFNIDEAYTNYDDQIADPDYWNFTLAWLESAWLASDDVLALHGNDFLCETYFEAAGHQGWFRNRFDWINLHYRFGQHNHSRFIDSRTHCLLYSVLPRHTWNLDDILVESDRKKGGDKRIGKSPRKGMRAPLTVWGSEVDDDGALWNLPADEVIPKAIPGHAGYFATWDGYIISRKRKAERVLAATLNPDGYYGVKVSNGDGTFTKSGVHRLVCKAFHGPPGEGMQCCHLDGVRTNNCADNLCWGTPADNAADRSWHGNWDPLRGEDHPQAKITNKDVASIRLLIDAGTPYREIAEQFPISKAQISRIKTGQRHMPPIIGLPRDGPFLGRVQGNSKERVAGRPNQLPEKYLERLIRAFTNPGDLVVDPFCGTGTTAVVADALGRDCIAIDIDPEACQLTEDRLKRGAVRVRRESRDEE